MPNILRDDSDPDAAARRMVDFGLTATDLGPREPAAQPQLAAVLGLKWPPGLVPQPIPLQLEPSPASPLPKVDVMVCTWTIAEQEALADTLTPGVGRNAWYRYNRSFSKYRAEIRDSAPAARAKRLGSYYLTQIGAKKVLCFKSELHMHQDSIPTGAGTATLPLRRMFHQMIDEAQPALFITVGTAGATFGDHALGDVVITRAAKFRLAREFAKEPSNGKTYRSSFTIPTKRLRSAQQLMRTHARQLVEPDFGSPTKRYAFNGPLIKAPKNAPRMWIDGIDLPDFHPILTTDFFEFGTSKNRLERQGCGVEMDDAVLGLVIDERRANDQPAPDWLVIRNASDPQINGDLPDKPRSLNMQTHWAVWYCETCGYWTSVNSAIATWAMIAD